MLRYQNIGLYTKAWFYALLAARIEGKSVPDDYFGYNTNAARRVNCGMEDDIAPFS